MRRSKIAAQSGDDRRGKESDFDAQADVGGGGIDDNADYICWFCHADVSLLGNNKCAGCRKVTHTSRFKTDLDFLHVKHVSGAVL